MRTGVKLLAAGVAVGLAVSGCGGESARARTAGATRGTVQIGSATSTMTTTAGTSPTPSTKPCTFVVGKVVSCASTDPKIGIQAHNSGDTSGCTFGIDMNWGDHSPIQHLTVHGWATTGEYAFAAHTFQAHGKYRIQATGRVLSGWCSISNGSYTFVLEHRAGTLRLAALGDSYSSGEGTRSYEKQSGACHRSTHAWPLLVADASPRILLGEHLACSGANSGALGMPFKGQQPQLHALEAMSPKATLVTMTMGGNDVGFADVLGACYTPGDCVNSGDIRRADERITAIRPELVADYLSVKGAAPSAAVVIVGYPRIFDATRGCVTFKPRELAALNRLADHLNQVIKSAASQAGVRYVDVTNAVKGHEMCTKSPWIEEVGIGGKFWRQEDGHPNIAGQHAIAAIVGAFLDRDL